MAEAVYSQTQVVVEIEDDDYSLEDEESVEEIVSEAWENIDKAKEHFAHWRQTACEEEKFYAGDQWTEEDRLKLDAEGRPIITFNRIIKFINAVAGMELQNRQEVRYLPTEINDTGFAEILTNAARWVRAKCNAEDEESEAFQDCIKIGMGWIETRMDYEDDIDGQVVIERVSPYEMLWDKNAQKNNLSDARWIARIKHMTVKEFGEFWPDVDPEVGDFWDGDQAELHDTNPQLSYKYKPGEGGFSYQGLVAVVQYQYWERKLIYRYRDIDGMVKEASESEFNKIKPILDVAQIKYVKQYKKDYKQCFFNGRKLLERGDCPTGQFTFTAITGLKDKYNHYWFGLMRLLMDPQRWSNKWFSQLLHIINCNAKGGLILEDGVFADPQAAMENWAKPDSIIVVNPGKLDRVREKPAPSFPAGIDRVLQYALQSFQDVSGVNAEILGLTDRTQPGVLEQQRKESVYGQLQQFFDALRYYRKVQGRVLAEFIKEYIAGDSEEGAQFVRITGDQGVKYLPLLKSDLTLKYDVIISDSPTAPNQRERTASLIMTLAPMLANAGFPIPPDIIEYMPLPEALVEKWKELIAQSTEVDPQQQALQQEMMQKDMMLVDTNLERQSLKNEELRTTIDLNIAKAQKELASAANNFAQSQESEEGDVTKPLLDYYELEREQARKDAEMVMKQRRANLDSILNMTDTIV